MEIPSEGITKVIKLTLTIISITLKQKYWAHFFQNETSSVCVETSYLELMPCL